MISLKSLSSAGKGVAIWGALLMLLAALFLLACNDGHQEEPISSPVPEPDVAPTVTPWSAQGGEADQQPGSHVPNLRAGEPAPPTGREAPSGPAHTPTPEMRSGTAQVGTPVPTIVPGLEGSPAPKPAPGPTTASPEVQIPRLRLSRWFHTRRSAAACTTRAP